MHSPQLLVFKDRAFKTDELELIHEVVDSCPRLSRQELANTVCELLGWRRANGGLKTWECKQLLEHLEQARGLGLPPLRETKPRGVSRRLPDSAAGEAGEVLRGRLREVAPVQLSLVEQPRPGDLLSSRQLAVAGPDLGPGAHGPKASAPGRDQTGVCLPLGRRCPRKRCDKKGVPLERLLSQAEATQATGREPASASGKSPLGAGKRAVAPTEQPASRAS